MVTILMLLAKIVTPVLKKKSFEQKSYDVIISVHVVINKILSRNSNYNVNVAM